MPIFWEEDVQWLSGTHRSQGHTPLTCPWENEAGPGKGVWGWATSLGKIVIVWFWGQVSLISISWYPWEPSFKEARAWMSQGKSRRWQQGRADRDVWHDCTCKKWISQDYVKEQIMSLRIRWAPTSLTCCLHLKHWLYKSWIACRFRDIFRMNRGV